jgi:hypothetical protein
VLLGDAQPTDVYAAPHVRVADDGRMSGVGRAVLFYGFGTTARFANGTPVRRLGPFTLWRLRETPRLAALAAGRYQDGWLGTEGRFTVWAHSPGTVRFTLSLPPDARPVTLRLGRERYRLAPGTTRRVRVDVDRPGRWTAPFESEGGTLHGQRIVSVRSTLPAFTPSR